MVHHVYTSFLGYRRRYAANGNTRCMHLTASVLQRGHNEILCLYVPHVRRANRVEIWDIKMMMMKRFRTPYLSPVRS